jgi:hypothetical protein
MLKNITKYAIFGISVAVVTLFLGKSCYFDPQYQAMKLRYETYRQIVKADMEIHGKLETEKNAIVEKQDKQIKGLLANVGKPTPAEIGKDKEITNLKKEVAQYESQGNLRAALDASKEENRQWEIRFSLAEEQHKKEIFSLNIAWEIKFDAQFVLTDSWKKQYTNEHNLRIKGEGLTSRAERGWKWAKLWSGVKSVGLVILGGLWLYDKLHK